MYKPTRYNNVGMREQTFDLCKLVGQVDTVPLSFSPDGTVHSVNQLIIEKSKYNIPDYLIAELANYLEAGDVIIIANPRAVRSF